MSKHVGKGFEEVFEEEDQTINSAAFQMGCCKKKGEVLYLDECS